MESFAAMTRGDDLGVLVTTLYRVVNPHDEPSGADATAWSESLTSKGGEGMVKPLDFVVKNSRGLVQTAIKCRGPGSGTAREYNS